MNILKMLLKILLTAGAALQLTACSKTVQWEEEVPLNTGDTIWVKRTVNYTLQGGAGNPLDIAYRPEWVEKLEFTWSGKKYVYEGVANVIVLAISPQKRPVLVARASDKSWEVKHKHPCANPSYVQLVPDAKGRIWTWPAEIETWLYAIPANLMLKRSPPNDMHKTYSIQERATQDAIARLQSPSLAMIDHTFNYNVNCKFYKS